MKNFELKGSLRASIGKKEAKKLRTEQRVPCVLYGTKSENVHFHVLNADLRHLVYSPNAYNVKLDIDGKQYHAIMQDIQFHPVSDHILHLDFVEVYEDKQVIMNIPLKVVGSAIGVKKGGKLKVGKRYLKVKALAKYLPEEITIDITDLEVGKSILIKDLQYDNLSIIDIPTSQVVGVLNARTVVETPEAAAAAAAPKAAAAPAKAAAAAPAKTDAKAAPAKKK